MACDKASLYEYLADFTLTRPLEAVYCPYTQDAGAGMGVPVFGLFVFGIVGLGLTVRTQHPGPVVVAGMLSAAAIAPALPPQAATIFWIGMVFAIAALGLYLIQRARSSTGGL